MDLLAHWNPDDEPLILWMHPEKRVYEASKSSPGDGYVRIEVVPRDLYRGAVKALERIAEAGETASQPLPQMMGRVAQQALDNLQPGGQ